MTASFGLGVDERCNWGLCLCMKHLGITSLIKPPRLPTMTSSNGNIFRLTGPFCVPVNSPHKGQGRGALMFSLICAWINDWVNNREAGDLRRHRNHYDVNVITGVTLFLSVRRRRRRRRRRRHLHYHPRLQACVHTITPGHLFWFVSLLADWWPWSIDNLLRFWSNFPWPWP